MNAESDNATAGTATRELLNIFELKVDPAVQRSWLEDRKVNNIANNFNPDAVGDLNVALRDNGDYIVLDGWHRQEAIRRLHARGKHDGKTWCKVHSGLTAAEESQLFLDLNAGNQPNVLDKFRQMVRADDAKAVRINNDLNPYGWTITRSRGEGTVQCIAAINRIDATSQKISAEPSLLQVTIMVVTRSWGHDPDGAKAPILEAISGLFAEYGERVSIDTLIQALKNYKGGPHVLSNKATDLAKLKNIKVTVAMAEILVTEYNKIPKSKANQLPNWTRRTMTFK